MKKILLPLLLLTVCGAYKANAQGMAVNTSGAAANSSAILDVSSTTQGMLVPRMTAAQRGAITGVQGLLVYQTDAAAGFWYYDGSAWFCLSTTALSRNASNLSSGTVPSAFGGAGTVNGILKADGSGVVSQATAGTDYLAPSSTLDATKLSGALPALNGSALTNLPSGGGSSNIIPLGGTLANNATISGTSTNVVYFTANGNTVSLPSANKAGQQIIVLDTNPSANGITVGTSGGDKIIDDYNGAINVTSLSAYRLGFISDGAGLWYTFIFP